MHVHMIMLYAELEYAQATYIPPPMSLASINTAATSEIDSLPQIQLQDLIC